MPQSNEHTVSRNANTAGAPLPLIPRRANSTSRISSTTYANISPSRSNPSLSVPSHAFVTATYPSQTLGPSDESDSSSSTGSGCRSDSNSVKQNRPQASTTSSHRFSLEPFPVQLGTDTIRRDETESLPNATGPRTFSPPLLYTPGISLRVTTSNQQNTEQHTPLTAPLDCMAQSRLIRKKSGQLVKPSLKPSTSCSKAGLTVVTVGLSSKSAPTTPTLAKAVHFDTQLEHVKLFLAEQKPLAVSRDGSPTDDTSGTDSDFPPFIYGVSDERSHPGVVMRVTNMPTKIDPTAYVALESLRLASEGATIVGNVKLRNIAYMKNLVVRFTFDDWQTTSEVTGKYAGSINSFFDRFTFLIKLHDLLSRIDNKKLILALKYIVNGREIWDNNSGQNYVATFSKSRMSSDRTKSESGGGSGNPRLANLRSRLEKVVQTREGSGFGTFIREEGDRCLGDTTSPLKTNTSLASRYDFESSLKTPWKPLSTSQARSGADQTAPLSNFNPWPAKASAVEDSVSPIHGPVVLGSPRDLDADSFRPMAPMNSETNEINHPLRSPPIRTGRNHNRGYFDVNRGASGVKRTPPGTPVLTTTRDITPLATPRTFSFPSVVNSESERSSCDRQSLLINDPSQKLESCAGSDDSTPSIVTPSSSRSTTPSPSPSPTDTQMMELLANTGDGRLTRSPSTDYRQFLKRYCFFTGSGVSQNVATQSVPRTQSTSDIEDLLTGTSPRLHGYANNMATTPTKSPSLENLTIVRSNSTTPTTNKVYPSGSRSPSTTATPGTGRC
ncbi:carbohydrate-binding module family 21 protein [Amanita thiersii Skay4041]|uniref:Carbohydrate-binding module family 21 protein n=1 Tax=Amanita thiersii Skay4041 TaxID=703135 RepID=A0A2A9NU23_9AGAR|nr:carbohydrate-binding module family 21 protein [Amanita thiersii Skay4041]